MLYRYQESTPVWVSFENPTGKRNAGGKENGGAKGHPCEPFAIGEEKTLVSIEGEGVVRRIWLTVADRAPDALQHIRLRMFWDGEVVPAVDVPLGDFFCMGHGHMKPFENALFASPEGRSFVCKIPMPFRKGARITITNETGRYISHIFYDAQVTLEKLADDCLYFHAVRTVTEGSARALTADVPIMPRIPGKGRFIGTHVAVNVNPDYGDAWWGEGEVKVYFGDDAYPTLVGTGTEDYIGTAWGQGEYINDEQGCMLLTGARSSFYRFHLSDPIYFARGAGVFLQNIGGAPLPKVRALMERGAELALVCVDVKGNTRGLFGKDVSVNDLPEEGFIWFYRKDDFSCVAYLYHERAGCLD